MKKIGRCLECEREVYINDERYCKRCYRDVMLSGQLEGETAKEQPKGSIIIEDEDETEE